MSRSEEYRLIAEAHLNNGLHEDAVRYMHLSVVHGEIEGKTPAPNGKATPAKP